MTCVVNKQLFLDIIKHSNWFIVLVIFILCLCVSGLSRIVFFIGNSKFDSNMLLIRCMELIGLDFRAIKKEKQYKKYK